MNYLAVDTSSTHLTIALGYNKKVQYTFEEDIKLQHSCILMPEIEKLLLKSGANLNDIDVFACCVGPGSFTGIRIGVSAIKAFAFSFGKKVLPVTSFETLAYNKRSGRNLCVIDARHGNFYVQGFDGVTPCSSPTFLNEERIKETIKDYDGVLSFENTSVSVKNCDLVKGFIAAVEDKIDTASDDSETLVPLYVRKSQAEESL